MQVGTNNENLLKDPTYKGIREPRITGDEYNALVDEFMAAVKAWGPHVLVQMEDFANHSAFRHLSTHRDSLCCFNDDIQGTACVALAGVLAGLRITGQQEKDLKVLFHGAGEAGIGIGDLIAMSISKYSNIPLDEARRHCFFLDSKVLFFSLPFLSSPLSLPSLLLPSLFLCPPPPLRQHPLFPLLPHSSLFSCSKTFLPQGKKYLPPVCLL